MHCYVCGGGKVRQLLDKPPSSIATGAADQEVDDKFSCVLAQCARCGHVFEPMTGLLREGLRKVYCSRQAQLSVSMGTGNWGQSRAERLLQHLTNILDFGRYRSVLEIGCDKGFFLRVLAGRGIRDLTGIEPSLSSEGMIDGIHFLKDFVREDLSLGRTFDLICAFDVFDHIEDIAGVMKFSAAHLSDGGDLFLSVTNADRYLSVGSPSVFTHQHVQCFTKDSLKSLLTRCGFTLRSISEYQDEYHIVASHGVSKKASYAFIDYAEYSEKLEKNLFHIKRFLFDGNAMVHGATNTLKNVLEWIGDSPEFTLIDNDACKHGKSYFGRIVKPLDDVDLDKLKRLLIVPEIFFSEIESDYRARGFQGDVAGLIAENIRKE